MITFLTLKDLTEVQGLLVERLFYLVIIYRTSLPEILWRFVYRRTGSGLYSFYIRYGEKLCQFMIKFLPAYNMSQMV